MLSDFLFEIVVIVVGIIITGVINAYFPEGDSRKKFFTYAAWIVIIGVLLFSAYRYGQESAPTIPLAEQVEVTRTVPVEVTNERTIEVTRLVEVTSSSDAIAQSNDTVSSEPTATAVPTIVVELPEVQSAGYVFSDDFDRGLDELWSYDSDNVGMANGSLTIISNPETVAARSYSAILDQLYWENFSVTITLDSFVASNFMGCSYDCDAAAYGAVILRSLQGEPDIGLLIQPSGIGVAFGTMDDRGNWTIQSGTVGTGFNLNFASEIIIEVEGNNYFAFVNGTQVSSATIPGPTIGQIGLWLRTGTQSPDQSNKYAPRFQSISIEALP